jgi:leucyl/phenylalanyl-tRNA--protein transferase
LAARSPIDPGVKAILDMVKIGMSRIDFPDPRTFDYNVLIMVNGYYYTSDGVVHYGGKLTVENLRNAYLAGIFPWFTDGLPLPWHCPKRRAILDFENLHIPRSLEKLRRREEFRFTIDSDFRQVITECSVADRPGQPGTWITKEFIEVYCELYEAGMAHSVEAWDANGELVGGLYGVDAGGVFCGESMFYKRPNASKCAFLYLVDHLWSRGSKWLDVQVMTPHMKALGAAEIPRNIFLIRLRKTQLEKLKIFG